MLKVLFSTLAIFIASLSNAQVIVNSTNANGSYVNLKEAFDAINNGTHQGNIQILLGSAPNQTINETSQPVINRSGVGGSSYSNIYIKPAFSNITLLASVRGTCCIPSGVLHMNGAKNIIIDGRTDTTSSVSNLTIENTDNGSTWASAIVLNGASHNIIQYCTIKSSSGSGTISFLYNNNVGITSGCQNNIISNCTVTKSGSNLPVSAIVSCSTSSINKSINNIIKECTISDFKRYGVWLGDNTISTHDSGWSIINNRFFQTTLLTLDFTNYCNYAICVGYHDIGGSTFYSSSGSHHIMNNMIGGDGNQGNLNITSNTANSGYAVGGIYYAGSGTVYSEISGNTISNYNVATFVSDQTSFSLAGFNGIYVYNSKVRIGSVSGNNIRNITLEHRYNSWSGVIAGIQLKNNTDRNCIIKNNSITNINSISGVGSFQYFYGIKNSGSSSVYTDQIQNNRISKLTLKLNSNFFGISCFGSISQNRISKINVQNGTADLIGLQFNGAPSAALSEYSIDNNEIILGIDSNANSTASSSNIIGMDLNRPCHAYYNSVVITGAPTGAGNTVCLKVNSSTGTGFALSNNLLYNDRKAGTGYHFNIITTGSNAITFSNNAYLLYDANKLAKWNNALVCSNLSEWQSASGELSAIFDSSSNKPLNVFFPNILGANESLYPYTNRWLCSGAPNSKQFDLINNSRATIAPTTLGCYELNCNQIVSSNNIYVFIGDGHWDNPLNWQNQTIPPSVLPENDLIIIDPVHAGECILNTPQHISSGANITVRPNKKFRVSDSLVIQ